MGNYTKQDIIQLVEEKDVQFIRLQFTDVSGTLKNVAITASQLEKALDNKCMFDGSSIEGFVRIEESDMYLYPDLNTFEILPWRPQHGKVARFMCDVYRPEGVPFEGDSRYVLKNVLKKAAKMGYTFDVGPECEFFLFHTDDNGQPTNITHEKASYLDVTPLDLGENARRDIVLTLESMGFEIEASHHEVAPAQHELAPIYAECNVAVDHNQIIMETLKKVAGRHGLQCLLHEKPFAGVNGSGKHDNWSITTDDGINLLEPGKTPHENVQFLLVLTCILKAVDEHAALLRAAAADVGNDHRLGANEAPPAILSIYLGDQLGDVLNQLISTGTATHSLEGEKLETGVKTIPDFMKDATDRNRTSPFAFTGNKFEFRMVGSQDSVAQANIVLNTIVAEAFSDACDVLEKADDFELAAHDLIKKYAIEHQRIVFNGNGYSDEWVAEAQKRGLPNIKSMVDAIPAYTAPESVAAFEKFGVFTKSELESRVEIEYETYAKTINIEAKAMIDIAGKQIIPAVIKYTTELGQSIATVKSACASADVSAQTDILTETSSLLAETQKALKSLETVTAKGTEMGEGKEQAVYYRDEVKSAMDALRAPVDKLEMIVDKDLWPMPSYGDLIFEV